MFDQMLAVLDTIEAEVPKIPIRYGDDETSSVSDFMGTQFAQLTALVTKMASQFDDRQSDLDKYRATLDDEHKTRMEELEETFKLRTAELTEKEKEIEDKRRELDDRDNVHVRRELRERITNQLKQRLKEPLVTKTPATVRNTVVILCVGASAFLFWFAFQSQQQIGSTTVASACPRDGACNIRSSRFIPATSSHQPNDAPSLTKAPARWGGQALAHRPAA
jgi:DNA-binding transcriptional MerR regulator